MKRSISEQRMQTSTELEKSVAASVPLSAVPQSVAAGLLAGSVAVRSLPHQSSLRMSSALPGAAQGVSGSSVISSGRSP